MVGNDFSINKNRELNTKRPVHAEEDHVFYQTHEEPQYAFQNTGTLAFNAPVSHHISRVFALPSFNIPSLNIFTKTRMVYLTVVLILVGIAAGAIIYKQQIINLTTAGVTYIAAQVSHPQPVQKAASPAVNPQQLTVYSSNYNTAITDIITQQVTLNFGSTSVSVNGSDIASWVSAQVQGSNTILSINSSELSSYLNKIVSNATQNGVEVTNYNAVYNQIANNLFKAKGITAAFSTQQ